jgi:TolB-like protein/class 3 adenylate cyclase/Flp pilus assembly protein TadD
MAETRKIAAILAADVVGFSRMASEDEDGTLARLRTLRSELIDPTVASQNGRVFKRTGDGTLVEFRSVVEAVRSAITIQNAMTERNFGMSSEQRIELRIGIHLGDVVEESDGDLMGDGVNIAARLEGIAEPGAICLSEDAYRQVKARLDLAVTDLGPMQLKNIAEPIRAYSLEVGKPAQTKPAPAPSSEKSVPPRLSIVVLPFANLGGGPEQDYFVDGVTESLTTDLSRIAGSLVIARNTAFTYKGKPIDVKKIGRELTVGYVLAGSVQRGGNRMRINVQLIDTETGSHLWAERFDRLIVDLFEMQDEIVSRLANRLGQELVAAEAGRASKKPNPDSIDETFLALSIFYSGFKPENLQKAHTHFDRALALDPDNVWALVGRAWVAITRLGISAGDRAHLVSSAENDVIRAMRLRPDRASCHAATCMAYAVQGRFDEAIAAGEHALALDANCALAHVSLGTVKIYAGRSDETEAHITQALRVSPRDINAPLWATTAAIANVHLGRDREAAGWTMHSIEGNRDWVLAHIMRAAAEGQLGRFDEARRAAQTALLLDPTFTIATYRSKAHGNNPAYLSGLERICDGLRLAGIPEH